ncbi:ribbon-helix-helix protein, CopG family [Lautropia mirabilis]|uniref:ribbon-helix-helix protein, CopG family n=1 Tax=Lautropia mirabilis TaxID=47671 RepID=UPI00234AF9B1|nr:ribbon-helix-helix protein, CopG family [Lautropia mirabilis]MDC6094491.1 ribbon-helix-helix protein, CopG family [Lautropia mirabilis]
MTTTVKLPPELEHQLRQRSTQEGRSISELMRDALSAYLQNVPAPRASAFSLGADLFGRHAGPADLSTERRRHLADAWEEKHRRGQ